MTPTISVNTSGVYYVTITNTLTGCSVTDSIHVNILTGLSENFASSYPLNVYPNPSNDKSFNLNFDVPESGDVEVKIMNQLGMVIYREKLANFKGIYNKKIALQNLAAGIYFADVIRDSNRSTVKISLD